MNLYLCVQIRFFSADAHFPMNKRCFLSQIKLFDVQLFFADRERRSQTEFRGVKLDRFVYHSLSDGCALFSVHVPSPGAYYLEIFANKVTQV